MYPHASRTRKESATSTATSDSVATTNINAARASRDLRTKSPTFSTTTAASSMPFPAITRADLRTSIGTYEDLVSAMAAYRGALATVAHASASLARILETCSRLKGVSDEAAVGFQAAGGLHHVIANHEQVLGRTMLDHVEKPLRQHLESYKSSVSERSAAYERTLIDRSRVIRQTEKESLLTGRRRQRDLASFRQALSILQAQVDDLDRLKSDYYESVLMHEENVWDAVLGKVAFSVRSTLDVYDRITSKASDPQLEPLILSIPDPFDTYTLPGKRDGPDGPTTPQIFSILPPLSMSSLSSSPSQEYVRASGSISPTKSQRTATTARRRQSSNGQGGGIPLASGSAVPFPAPSSPPSAAAPVVSSEPGSSLNSYASDWASSVSSPATSMGGPSLSSTVYASSQRQLHINTSANSTAETKLRNMLLRSPSSVSMRGEMALDDTARNRRSRAQQNGAGTTESQEDDNSDTDTEVGSRRGLRVEGSGGTITQRNRPSNPPIRREDSESTTKGSVSAPDDGLDVCKDTQ
ncbi:hypothetical protein FRB94_003623 [Tulasnella sp. JGI-2019a]|nr:hypothetical protein FRB94_003623 [Tulasnella sp. JGI-2019a]